MIKKTGIFIDLDGTLLNDKYEISRYSKDALSFFDKEKYKIYLVTGKSYETSINFYKELNLKTALVTSQGQEISFLNNDKNLITLQNQDIEDILNNIKWNLDIDNIILLSKKYAFYTINPDDALIKRVSNNEILRYNNKIKNNKILSIYINFKNTVEQEVKDEATKQSCESKTLDFSYWHRGLNHQTIIAKPKSVGKEFAMKIIAEFDNLDFTVAIGNGMTDKQMIIHSDIGIAMLNSEDDLKAAANIVTNKNNNDNGVVDIINQLIIDKTI